MRALAIILVVAACGDQSSTTIDAAIGDPPLDDAAETDAGGTCGDGTCSPTEDWYSCNADCPGRCDGCLFAADYDSDPCTQWSSCQRQAASRITSVNGTGRFEVQQGDLVNSGNRAEVVHCTSPSGGCGGEVEGTERWFGWSTLWPDEFMSQPTWQLFTQWHHVGNTGSPPIELYTNGNTMYLRTTNNAGNDFTVHWTAPLVTGKWRNFLLGIRFENDATGWVELWLDGENVLPRKATRTMIDQGNILKQGLYRNSAITFTQVIFHDSMRKGTTRDQVD